VKTLFKQLQKTSLIVSSEWYTWLRKFEQPHEIHIGQNLILLMWCKLARRTIIIRPKSILKDTVRLPMFSGPFVIISLTKEGLVMTHPSACVALC